MTGGRVRLCRTFLYGSYAFTEAHKYRTSRHRSHLPYNRSSVLKLKNIS